jgi:hypothetical protein
VLLLWVETLHVEFASGLVGGIVEVHTTGTMENGKLNNK